jgi:isochorismate synthase
MQIISDGETIKKAMSMEAKIAYLEKSKELFTLFRFPREKEVHLALGAYDENDIKGDAFMIQPFTLGKKKPLFIGKKYMGDIASFDVSMVEQCEPLPRKKMVPPKVLAQNYLESCAQAIEEIRKGTLNKVVLHIEKYTETKRSESEIFLSGVKYYKDAFMHYTRIPGENSWIGASPELLLSRNKNEYKSMSLAGTRSVESDIWTDKEYVEQELVTTFILKALSSVGVSEVTSSDLYDKQAGHLEHLCTDVSFEYKGSEYDVLKALHPTPAVCGSPRKEALELLHSLRMEDRAYYCGYLGIRKQDNSKYFVNLRCMELNQGQVRIYAGGGVTKDSIPEHEFEELNNKSRVMGRLIEYFD